MNSLPHLDAPFFAIGRTRGTGRTTLMLVDAFHEAKKGNRVFVLFPTWNLAWHAAYQFTDTFRCTRLSKSQAGVGNASVHFMSVFTVADGYRGVVLADHSIDTWPDYHARWALRQWRRVRPE